MTEKQLQSLVYTAEEVKILLGISRNSVYERIADGSLPSVRLGRRIVIPRAALEAWLAQAGNATGSAGER